MAIDYLPGCVCPACIDETNRRNNIKKEGSNMSEAITEVTEIGNARIAKLKEILTITENGSVSIMIEGQLRAASIGSQIIATFSDEVGGERLDAIEALVEANRVIYTHFQASEKARVDAQKAREAHRNDIRIIGERLNVEANDREWCAEYDQAVESLNSNLSISLPTREVEKEFRITGYIRVPFDHSFTATVKSGDPDYAQLDDAKEQWQENYGVGDVSFDRSDAEIEDDSLEVEEN